MCLCVCLLCQATTAMICRNNYYCIDFITPKTERMQNLCTKISILRVGASEHLQKAEIKRIANRTSTMLVDYFGLIYTKILTNLCIETICSPCIYILKYEHKTVCCVCMEFKCRQIWNWLHFLPQWTQSTLTFSQSELIQFTELFGDQKHCHIATTTQCSI